MHKHHIDGPFQFHDQRGEEAMRRCLKCRTDFDSEHRGHRICSRCSEINARSAPAERAALFGRGSSYAD
jgi:hypothetical protein